MTLIPRATVGLEFQGCLTHSRTLSSLLIGGYRELHASTRRAVPALGQVLVFPGTVQFAWISSDIASLSKSN